MPIIAAVMVPHPPLIIPEVGKGEEKQVQKTIDAYDKAGRFISELKPDTIIVSSPHSVMYSDYFHISPGKKAKDSFSRFAAPQVSFEEEYDEVDYEEDYGYDNDGDESEELIDDLDELLSSQPSKKRGHMEEDDTFKVDFIDLD